jgi:multiple antibiotic resistance protein
MIEAFVKSTTLMFVLLNPFLMSIYLMDLMQDLDARTFFGVLTRAVVISGVVFSAFATLGDVIFTDMLQARFASFLIFGGIVFLMVGIRFVFSGSDSLRALRGTAEHVSGSIAMPFIIGPATVSASVLAGMRMPAPLAAASIGLALALAVVSLVALKWILDAAHKRNERIVNRYIDIVGRAMALVIGTLAVEMILQGLEAWMAPLWPRS